MLFDQNAYQSIDLGGFVTGAGIATLQASSFAQSSTVYLMAPRGEIDFGTAGVRSSGDLVVIAPVIANASNVSISLVRFSMTRPRPMLKRTLKCLKGLTPGSCLTDWKFVIWPLWK